MDSTHQTFSAPIIVLAQANPTEQGTPNAQTAQAIQWPWFMDLSLIAIMTLGLVIIGLLVYFKKAGLGPRTIQFASIVLVFPTIILLSIHGAIQSQIVGTLIGTLAGYLLSSFRDEQPPKDQLQGKKDQGTGEGPNPEERQP